MQKTVLALVVAVAAFSSAAYADSTGLVGQTITPKPLPPMTDISKTEYANGYFDCGGGLVANGLSVTAPRKGMKASCQTGNVVYALTRISNNGKTMEFLDTIDVTLRKGMAVFYNDCKGADVTLTKVEDVEFFAKHVKAWKIADNKFVPMANTAGVKCANAGCGA